MTTFRQHREAVGWSIQHTADRLGVNERTIRRWDSGQFDPPDVVIAWLGKIAAFIEGNPPTKAALNDTG